MKKLLVTLCVALLSLGAYAQQAGDFAVGAKGSFGFNGSRIGFGLKAQYNITKHIRAEVEGDYWPVKEHASDVMAFANVHYLLNVGERFFVYPIAGVGVSFVKSEEYTANFGKSSLHYSASNYTDFGFQVGGGAQLGLTDNLFLMGEVKYQPGVWSNFVYANLGVGFKF